MYFNTLKGIETVKMLVVVLFFFTSLYSHSCVLHHVIYVVNQINNQYRVNNRSCLTVYAVKCCVGERKCVPNVLAVLRTILDHSLLYLLNLESFVSSHMMY